MDEIQILLSRGVDKVYPSKEELEKVLRSGKKLTLYEGFDPTGVQMHIGHMIGLRKLAQWQKLGHKVIFLIGDGTGQAGDPSGKTRSRDAYLSNEELRQNARDYVMQAGKIVDFEGDNPVEIRFNGDWLNKMSLADVLDVAGHFTLQQMIERDLYQERLKNNEPLNLREFMYPLLQAYDSVAMEVDLEIGGSDQTFNMLCGRQLVKDYLSKEKYVMTTPLLTDSSGRKIGKTEGNVIALNDNPNDLYAKILGLGDDVIVLGMEYLTDISFQEIEEVKQAIQSGENPMQYKKQLAFEIVRQLHSVDQAANAQEEFEKTVQHKELPTEIIEVKLQDDDDEYLTEDLLVELNLASSKSEAKRLFEQGGVELDGERIVDSSASKLINDGSILRVGKRKIVKLLRP
jgi:tyrosyl-tRNA synthetase